MDGLGDSWNLIKIRERSKNDSKDDVNDPMTSLDVISDEGNVDDDILSNTSSDDNVDIASTLKSKDTVVGNSRYLGGSFETLTGSIVGQTPWAEERESEHQSARVKDDVKPSRTHLSVKNNRDRFSNFYRKTLMTYEQFNVKTWHVIVITSMLSMLVFIGVQNYSPSILNNIIRKGSDSSEISHYQSAQKNDLIYGEINFLNRQDPDILSWKPTGKYYVDFDNHIAYPIAEEDTVGWRKYKTEVVLSWHTLCAKARRVWHSIVIPSGSCHYQSFHRLIKINGDRYNKFCHAILDNVINWYYSFPTSFKQKYMNVIKVFKVVSHDISEYMKTVYHSKIKCNLLKISNSRFVKQQRKLIKNRKNDLTQNYYAEIRFLQKIWRNGKKTANRKYKQNVAPFLKRQFKKSSETSKELFSKLNWSLQKQLKRFTKIGKLPNNKETVLKLKKLWAKKEVEFRKIAHKGQDEAKRYKCLLGSGISSLGDSISRIWQRNIAR